MSDATPPTGVVSASSDAGGIRIVRVFDAPRERVFEAWTRAEDFAMWFGEHDSSVPLDRIQMDPRPGGAWSLVMLAGPEGTELHFGGEFVEVVAPERVVMTLAFGGPPEEEPLPSERPELFTVGLRDTGDGRTEMTFSQTGGNLPADEYSRAMRGELIFLDRMAELVSPSLKARHDQDGEEGERRPR